MKIFIEKDLPDSNFYNRDTVTIAKELLGKLLVHYSPEGITAGIIVETEAYMQGDEACHANKGMTPRNKIMFGDPGFAYIYFTYGMHYCFNVVTAPQGVAEAVLLRALEPVAGIDLMKKRRGREVLKELCSGPAKLVQAMGIGPEMYGHNLTRKPLVIMNGVSISEESVLVTTRIGISAAQDLPLRFYLKGNDYISRK